MTIFITQNYLYNYSYIQIHMTIVLYIISQNLQNRKSSANEILILSALINISISGFYSFDYFWFMVHLFNCIDLNGSRSEILQSFSISLQVIATQANRQMSISVITIPMIFFIKQRKTNFLIFKVSLSQYLK